METVLYMMIAQQQRAEVAQISSGLLCRTLILK